MSIALKWCRPCAFAPGASRRFKPGKRVRMFRRRDNRQSDQLRPIKFTRNFTKNADGSVLVEFGDTKVFTTAKIEERVPAFLIGKGEGWITAEYSLLPGSTPVRSPRE